jgi:hypothetical protein
VNAVNITALLPRRCDDMLIEVCLEVIRAEALAHSKGIPMSNGNVVALNTKTGRDSALSPAQIASLGKQVRDTATGHLQKLFQNMFDHLDDFLFDQADKSEKAAPQSAYFEAMRRVRLQKDQMRSAFLSKFHAGFNDAIGGPRATAAANLFEKGSLDSLLLVNDEELEESLAVTNMVAKAKNLHKEHLYALEQRFRAMYQGRAEITADTNPLGPQVICTAFKGAAKGLDVELKVKLVMYKLFDRYLVHELGAAYEAVNALLADAGVLPAIRVRATVNPAGAARAPAPRASASTPPASGAATSNGNVAPRGAQPQVFDTLQHLLMMQRRMSAHASGDVAADDAVMPGGGAAVFDTPTVLVALSSLQHQPMSDISQMRDKDEIAAFLKNSIVTQLRAGDPKATGRINQADTDTIDIVTMLFDFILDDAALPDAFKALIARLQIPVLKVGIIDKTFFAKKNHPARRLLNELARAGVGWTEVSNRDSDPLYRKVEHVVHRVLNEFENDVRLFSTLLDEFTAFLEEEKHQRKIAAERLEATHEIVAHEIERRIAAPDIPLSIRQFMSTAWKDVLVLIHSRDGNQGRAWEMALQVADDLVWSVQPKLTGKQRQRLVQMIPKILNGLQDGLTLISYHRNDKERLFRELEQLHLVSLKGDAARGETTAAPTAPVTEKPAPGSRAALDDLINDLNAVPMLVEDIVMQEPGGDDAWDAEQSQDEFTARVAQIKVGTWVEFTEATGKTFRAKLAWKSEVLGEYTFVDRMYKVVADKTLQELAADFRDARARTVEDVPVLDRALDAVINGLKRYVYSGDGKVSINTSLPE